jgi:hypothetical protein
MLLLRAEHLNGAAAQHADASEDAEFAAFREAAKRGNLVPLYERIFADQLTPVTAYRCLVAEDDREAPSFLFESVVNGTQTVKCQPSFHASCRPCNTCVDNKEQPNAHAWHEMGV